MNTFKNVAKLSAGLFAAALVLTGCSNDPEPTTEPDTTTSAPGTDTSTPATEPSVEPSAEPTVDDTPATEPSADPSADASTPPSTSEDGTFSGTGYTVEIPDGWKQDTSQSVGDLVLTTEPMSESSIIVMVVDAPGLDLDTLVAQGQKQLESMAKDFSAAPEKSVDGMPAKGFQGTLNTASLPFAQYYILKDGKAYAVTFGGDKAKADIDTLLSGWKWAS